MLELSIEDFPTKRIVGHLQDLRNSKLELGNIRINVAVLILVESFYESYSE